MQRVLILNARGWLPEGEPEANRRFFCTFATAGATGGLEVVEGTCTRDVFRSIGEHVPCFGEANLAIAGTYKGQPKLMIDAVDNAVPFKWPVRAPVPGSVSVAKAG